jgi:hypothetical protein
MALKNILHHRGNEQPPGYNITRCDKSSPLLDFGLMPNHYGVPYLSSWKSSEAFSHRTYHSSYGTSSPRFTFMNTLDAAEDMVVGEGYV